MDKVLTALLRGLADRLCRRLRPVSANKTSHQTPSWKDLLRIVAPGIGLGGLHVRREDTGH
jgi:hypothetical protein